MATITITLNDGVAGQVGVEIAVTGDRYESSAFALAGHVREFIDGVVKIASGPLTELPVIKAVE